MNPLLSKRRYLILGALFVSVLIAAFFLVRGQLSNLPSTLKNLSSKKPTVELTTSYKNPFNKGTQYVNPFEKYKNPFVTNR